MKRGLGLVLTWLLLGVGPAAPALALNTPPGNSAGNQYVETLPGASSNKALTPGSGRGLAAEVRRALAARGKAGLLVLGLGAQAPTQAVSHPHSRAHRQRRSRSLTLDLRPVVAQAPIPAVSGVLTGTGPAGLGWGLPAVLVLITVLALILARRPGSRSDLDG